MVYVQVAHSVRYAAAAATLSSCQAGMYSTDNTGSCVCELSVLIIVLSCLLLCLLLLSSVSTDDDHHNMFFLCVFAFLFLLPNKI